MPIFFYKTYDYQGSKLDGQIDSLNIESARESLERQQLMVVSIIEVKPADQAWSLLSRTRVKPQELEYLTSELALLLNSGVTIDRGLEVIRRNTSSIPQARLVVGLHEAVRRGETLSTAMDSQAEVFSPLYINLVRLGESSGTLPRVFRRLAEDIKFQSELKRQIVQALTYPMVVFAVCILCILFVFNYIVPQMSGLFQGLPEIPFYTSLLLSASDWMINYQWYLFATLSLSIFALAGAVKTPAGARQVDAILMRAPGLKHVFLLVDRVRFNTAIAMMLSSGILIDRCLEMASGSVKSQTIRHSLVIAKERVKKGDALSSALASSPLFTDFSISLIEVGEESGQLGPVFNELSARSRIEFEGWVARATSILEPLLIVFMGGIVGGVVVTMLLSIVSVNDIGI